jgi:hypothetical protein
MPAAALILYIFVQKLDGATLYWYAGLRSSRVYQRAGWWSGGNSERARPGNSEEWLLRERRSVVPV